MKPEVQHLRNVVDEYEKLLLEGEVFPSTVTEEMEMLAVLLVDIVRHIKYASRCKGLGKTK